MLLTLTFSELCPAIFGRDKTIQQDDTLVHGRNSLVLATATTYIYTASILVVQQCAALVRRSVSYFLRFLNVRIY